MNKKIISLSIAVLGFAAITPAVAWAASSPNAACVHAALGARDTAVENAITAYESSVNAANNTWTEIYDATTTPGTYVDMTAVWMTYKTSLQNAQTVFNAARDGAHAQLIAAMGVCRS